MIDVKEVLRRWSWAQGDRKMARETGADRNTIVQYTKAAARLGLERGLARSARTASSQAEHAALTVPTPLQTVHAPNGSEVPLWLQFR